MAIKLWRDPSSIPRVGRYFAVVQNHGWADLLPDVPEEPVFKSFEKKEIPWSNIVPQRKGTIRTLVSFEEKDEVHMFTPDVLTWIRRENRNHNVTKWRYLTKKESAIKDLTEM